MQRIRRGNARLLQMRGLWWEWANMRRKQRNANPFAHMTAIMGASLLNQHDIDAKTRDVDVAVNSACHGVATRNHWKVIFHTLNMLEEFSRHPKIMRGASGYIQSMQGVIVGILDRHKKTGTKSLYTYEITDLRGMYELWCDVLVTVTMSEYYKAESECARRAEAILASGTRGVHVVEIPE